MSEEEAHDQLKLFRWPATQGRPVCPAEGCGCEAVYDRRRECRSRSKKPGQRPIIRRSWECKRCRKYFSVTSGTPFAGRKLPFWKILAFVAHFSARPKNVSAIDLSMRLRCHYTTAFVMAHKVREVMNAVQLKNELAGPVEIDATYTGGHHRVANLVNNRKDRRRRDRSKQACITIIRERGERGRSVAIVTRSDREALPFIRERVKPGRMYADEAPAYNALHARYDMRRIDHTNEGYAVGDRSTNWAESFFSRFKRAVKGTHHHISGPYIQHYANEISWREDRRRASSQDQYREILASTLAHAVSRMWKGYWQRSSRTVQ